MMPHWVMVARSDDRLEPPKRDRQTNKQTNPWLESTWTVLGVARADPSHCDPPPAHNHMRLTKEAPATAFVATLHDTGLASTSARCYTSRHSDDTTAPGHHSHRPPFSSPHDPLPIPRHLHARRKWLYVTGTARLDPRQRVADSNSSHTFQLGRVAHYAFDAVLGMCSLIHSTLHPALG
jgi:hypothetical protein